MHLNQIGLVVHIIHLVETFTGKAAAKVAKHLVDSHPHVLLQLLQDGDDVQGCEPDNWPSTFFTDARLVLDI